MGGQIGDEGDGGDEREYDQKNTTEHDCSGFERALYLLPMPSGSFLARLGLDRPELRAWAMYDWANSAVQTTIITAVFPIYFVKVAGAGLAESGAVQRLAAINTIALVIT
ncbi:MAG: hypothetical protein H0W29_05305, partial [Gemmatimonadales bacterium]|nr:hypothetical protein [Gemmatimonadales bacterium]